MIKECSPRMYRCFSRLWQKGFSFADLPLLGSCIYSHSSCPGAPNARVKYVAHRASCCIINLRVLKSTFLGLDVSIDLPCSRYRRSWGIIFILIISSVIFSDST